MFFGFLSGFLWICECLGTPFSLLTSVPLVLKPILTFSKGRNKLLYFVKDFFSQLLQSITSAPSRSPPKGRCRLLWFCQRLVDAGYSGSVKDRLMLVALVVDKSLTIRRLQANNNIANGICPSPSGEARWGLLSICRVSTLIPLGKEVFQHLQIQLNPDQNPKLISSIMSKIITVKRPIRVPPFNPCFLFFDLCSCQRLGTQRRHGINISENNVSIDLR